MKNTLYLNWKANPSKGEVFTPIGLVRMILNRIPNEVWTNPDSAFIDPCMGKGVFLIEIVRRLVDIYGYSEEDAKSRVFGYDIHVKYVNYLKRRGYKNVFHKDSLKELFKMKFDVVLGNPPYQDFNKKQGKNSSLWTKFILKSNEIVKNSGYILLITPISWIAPSETQKNQLKKIFNENNLVYLNTECEKYFNVGSTFSYFMIKKESQYIGTQINNIGMFDLRVSFLPKIINKNTLSITKKLFNNDTPKIKFSSSLRNDNIIENGKYKVWYGNDLKSTNVLGGNFDKPKVIVNKPGYLNPRFDNGKYNTSANNYWVEVDNEAQANNIISFFNSNVGSILMNKLFKYSGYNSLGVLKNLPKTISEHEWNTDKFIEIFNFTEDEISEILN